MPSSLRRPFIARSLSSDGSVTPTTRGAAGGKRRPFRRAETLNSVGDKSPGSGGGGGGGSRLPLRLPSKSDRRLKMRMASEFSSERGLGSQALGLEDLSKLLDESFQEENEKDSGSSSKDKDMRRTESMDKLKSIKMKLAARQSSKSPTPSSVATDGGGSSGGGRRSSFERSHSQSRLRVAHSMDMMPPIAAELQPTTALEQHNLSLH